MNENQPPKLPLVDILDGVRSEDAASEALQTEIDKALDHLAVRYAQLPEQADAEQKTLEALKTFTRALSDDELDWLAAAGPGVPGGLLGGVEPNDPVKPKAPGEPKR